MTVGVIGYLVVLTVAVLLGGVLNGHGPWFWGGTVGALLLYSGAFAVVLMPRPGAFSRRSAVAATGLVVAAQTLTWGTAVLDQSATVVAYEPLVVTAYVLYVMIIFRSALAVAWCGAVVGLTATLLLGPRTGAVEWWTALQTTSIVVLIVVTAASLAIMPLLGEIDALAIRYRRVAQERADDTSALTSREQRLERIDNRVRPVLEGILNSGVVTGDDVIVARLMEARLRDGIRAPALDTAPMREAVWRARSRGVSVTLLDDGGLRTLPEADTAAFLSTLLPLLVAELDALSEGELIARVMPPGRSPMAMVTVAWRGIRRRVEFGPDGFVARVVRV
ncbi:hypothetical protein ACH46_15735 [Gordonia phthalatica]|uniref:Uncharacterized protein n=1 Tax=Gordonia phthalatica TaxID=1136941 RepID=A0A0N9MW44_9ACTN|nr:hypothetical protein ACH46_15735 [Gordonia phthalatica]